jgi:hypothetical protein
VHELDRAEVGARSGEQADDPREVGEAQLVALPEVGHARFDDLVPEDQVLAVGRGLDLQPERRRVDVQIADDRVERVGDRLLVADDHGDRAEDVEPLPAREPQGEVPAGALPT